MKLFLDWFVYILKIYNILFQVSNYLDHVASFSTDKEMHAFVPMILKSFKLKYSKAPEVLLDLGTPRHQIYRHC